MITEPSRKQRNLFFISFGIVLCILLFSWSIYGTLIILPSFAHCLGLLLFMPVIYFLFKDKTLRISTVILGIYLLLGAINLIAFLPFSITASYFIVVGSFKIWSPTVNWIALVVFIIYAILNFDVFTDIYLDYKESKGKL